VACATGTLRGAVLIACAYGSSQDYTQLCEAYFVTLAFSMILAMRVYQPEPLAFQRASTSAGSLKETN
jgi:hypothetical protein